jgi:hypothetical protein
MGRIEQRTAKFCNTEKRISLQTTSLLLNTVFQIVDQRDYVYDANGNLVNGAVYDNKLNINRTNAVWMFITRDYSVNNPFTASQYNQNSLPLRFTATNNTPAFLPTAKGNVSVDYLCR